MAILDNFTAFIAIKDPAICNLLIRQSQEMGLIITDRIGSGTKLKESLQKTKPDILFLDIDLEGVSLFREIKEQAHQHMQIIIVTASMKAEYYQAGYDLGIADYVTKPISEQRLALAIKRGLVNLNKQNLFMASEYSNSNNQLNFIHYRNENGNNFIKEIEIVYIEKSFEQKCIIHSNKGQKLESISRLIEFKKQCSTQIITPHKSFLVNRRYISRICSDIMIQGNYEIILDGYNERVPLTREYYKQFINSINKI